MKFNNHFNFDPANPANYDPCDEKSIAVPGQVLPLQKLIERGLTGNIVNNILEGIDAGNDIDDVDFEKFGNMDITEKLELLESERERLIDRKVDRDSKKAQKALADIEAKKQALIDAKKLLAENPETPDVQDVE